MDNKLFEKISNYIIGEVAEKSDSSMSGFQYCVDYADIQELFAIEIEEFINETILNELSKNEKVADAELDVDGFDVVIYTDFAKNYKKEED